MQLSETITIYLSIGAPFGVNFFLRERTVSDGSSRTGSRARSIFKATGAGLLWPLVAVASLLSRRAASGASPAQVGENESALDEYTNGKVSVAQRQLFAALEGVREMAQASAAGRGEELEQTMRAAREGIEKYVGLTMALLETGLEDEPAAREMELSRIAGRKGDDLLLAGRCVHRRNVARLIAHHARSRTELLHALAAVREMGGEQRSLTSREDATAARRLSVAVLKFYGHAVNLLSLLEDETAALRTARLLDAECARLRKLEASSLNADDNAARVDGKHALHNYTDFRPTLARR